MKTRNHLRRTLLLPTLLLALLPPCACTTAVKLRNRSSRLPKIRLVFIASSYFLITDSSFEIKSTPSL